MAAHDNTQTFPEAGALFRYNDSRYRLNGYLCEMPKREPTGTLADEVLDKLEAETDAELPAGLRRIKLRWCLPEEATFVCGSGTAGCIAPIEDIEVVGRVTWSDEMLAEHQASAHEDGLRGEYVTTIIRPTTPSESGVTQ